MGALWLGSLIWDRWHVPSSGQHQLLSTALITFRQLQLDSMCLNLCTVLNGSWRQLSSSAVLANRIGMDPYRLHRYEHRLPNWQFVKGQLIYWHTLRASPSFSFQLHLPFSYTPSNWRHKSSVALLIMAAVWASRQADKRFCLWAIRWFGLVIYRVTLWLTGHHALF